MTEYAKKLLRLYHEQSKKNRTIQGSPPLTFKGKGKDLKNYRIYGNTVNGENVGDLITEGEHAGEYSVPVTVKGKNLVTSYLVEPNGGMQFQPVVFAEVNLQPNTEYLITFTVHENGVKLYSNDLLFTSVYYSSEIQGKKTMRLKTLTGIRPDQHINNKGWVLLRNAKQNPSYFTITDVKLQLVSDAPIYLDEPLAKSGNNADYIDYATQKRHNSDGTESSITLPALPTLSGTNTLSVGTEVQPSKVYIKGEFKKITTTYVQSIELDKTNNKIIFVVEAYLSKNDRMVRTGLVATNDPAIGVNINVNSTVITSGCKVFVKELAGVTPTTKNTTYTWTKTKVTDGEIWYVRSYVEYINSDNEQLIIYSDAAKASLDGII